MAPVLRQTLVCTRQEWLLAAVGLDVELCDVVEHVVENHCVLDVLGPCVGFLDSLELWLILLAVIVTLAGVLRGLVDALRGEDRLG